MRDAFAVAEMIVLFGESRVANKNSVNLSQRYTAILSKDVLAIANFCVHELDCEQ